MNPEIVKDDNGNGDHNKSPRNQDRSPGKPKPESM
jgi:hypothetical protein